METAGRERLPRARKAGFLWKLVGRGWLCSGSWKRRYCVLRHTKLYFYEKEGDGKASGVIGLDRCDACEESRAKDHQNAFVVGTSARGLFDERHQFAAESAEEMRDWLKVLREAAAEAKRRTGTAAPPQQEREQLGDVTIREPLDHFQDSTNDDMEAVSEVDQLVSANKERPRGPAGRRPPHRKTLAPPRSPGLHAEELDMRQRSISLSGPAAQHHLEVDNSGDVHRLSLSLEAVDQETAPPRKGRLGGPQHTALARALERRLKIGPPHRAARSQQMEQQISPSEEESPLVATETWSGKPVEDTSALQWPPAEVKEMLRTLDSSILETERLTSECKLALEDAKQAQRGYEELRRTMQDLREECQRTLQELRAPLLKESEIL